MSGGGSGDGREVDSGYEVEDRIKEGRLGKTVNGEDVALNIDEEGKMKRSDEGNKESK